LYDIVLGPLLKADLLLIQYHCSIITNKNTLRCCHFLITLRSWSLTVKEDCEIWSFHGSEDVYVGLLGCNTVWTCRLIPVFWRSILSPSSLHPWSGDITVLNICVCLQVHTNSDICITKVLCFHDVMQLHIPLVPAINGRC
jgi:hypothetical protein